MKIKVSILFLLISIGLIAQAEKKQYEIHRTETRPRIDGKLDDEAWQQVSTLKDFVMFQPGNGEPERNGFETKVKVLYDNHAIYFAIQMLDPNPDSILTQLTQRDDYNQNCDWIGVFINPFNDGLNDFNFWVTSSGVQADSRTTADGDDFGWNTIWKSKALIDNTGWIVELEIPYQSLRFPKQHTGTWGLNIIRNIRRYREEYSWNFIDKNIQNIELQNGRLNGIHDVNSPLRLSLIPNLTSSYAATPTVEDNNTIYTTNQSFNAGLDIKYGITESFTLDMMLLPDFTQVAYDKQILNLGPFENRFDEQRQFFKEGIELFNKGNLFYSRRIGGAPKNITGADISTLDDVSQNTTRVLNATKISGRTKHQLGIGFLNSITDENYAFATDPETGEKVRVLTEPRTNYNIISLDQRFNQNSSISFVNTNVMRDGDSRDANVSAIFAELANRENSYKYNGTFKYSSLFTEEIITGYEMSNSIVKTRGNFRFNLGQDIISDTYNQNDLGFQTRNNRFNHRALLSYESFVPSGLLNKYRIRLQTDYNRLYNPNVYESLTLNLNTFLLTTNFDAAGYTLNVRPIESYNYYEPRVWGERFTLPSSQSHNLWFSSDYRHKFALDFRTIYWRWSEYDHSGFNFTIAPRYRFNDHLLMVLSYKPEWQQNSIGWVNTINPVDSIVFGQRSIQENELNLRAEYVFNEDISLFLNFRHFWSYVNYSEYHLLQKDGSLEPFEEYSTNHDVNFNTLNIDIRFSWWYAPGSQLVFLYRNNLFSNDADIIPTYTDNLWNSLLSNQDHTFSLRITYFLDINYLRKSKLNNVNSY